MKQKILVFGASGNVGKHLVKALRARGESVKAASHSEQKINGAETVRFDLSDSDTFADAFKDVDRAFFMLPSGYLQITELLLPLVEYAATRNIKVVFQSVFGADADDSIPYRQVEIALQNSGTPYVILRPNWFADNFHNFWKPGIDQGQIALPAGDGKSSFIDARDIAASAAAALCSNEFDNNAYNLTGPAALSYAEAAAILSEVIGKAVSYYPVSDEDFIEAVSGAGVATDYAGFLASIFHPVREGWTAAVTGDVELLTGQSPLSLATYAKDYSAELRA